MSRGLGNRLRQLETSRKRQEVSGSQQRDDIIEEQLQSCNDPEILARYADAAEMMRAAQSEEEEGNAADAFLDVLEELRVYSRWYGTVVGSDRKDGGS